MSLLQKASIITTPTAYAEDYLYSIKPAQSFGSELVPNGTFDSGISGWVENGGAVLSHISANNSLQSVSTSGGKGAVLTASITVTVGKKYIVQAECVSVTGTCNLRIGTSTTGTQYLETSAVSIPTVFEHRLTATSTSLYIYLRNASASTTQWDNVSVKEVTDADFDFDRNSTGTRVNEDYLIEDVPYNLLTYSNDFSNGAWSKSNATLTSNNVISPDGTLNASKLEATGADGLCQQSFSAISGTQYTFSVYLKTVSGTLNTNISLGSPAFPNTEGDGGRTKEIVVTNQWKRFSITSTADASASTGIGVGGFSSFSTGEELYLYGAQLVKGNQPKDYLKTTDRLDIPRIDYTNGEPSILLEPSRTNLVTYSQDLSQWTLVNGTLTANATVSPEGIQNSGKIAFSSVGLDLKRTITVVAGTTYTISFYIKVEEGTGLQGRFYDNSNSANIEYYNYDDQIIPNQWSRITRSVTAPSGCTEMQIWLLASSTTLVTASWWGAQFEAGSYATSLIHTSGSAVTRSADAANNAGNSDLFNDSAGALYFEGFVKATNENLCISINDGTTSNRVELLWFNDGNFYTQVGNSGQTSISSNTDNNKIAIGWGSGVYYLYLNGRVVITDTFTSLSGLKSLDFKRQGSFVFYGNCKSLMVFDQALTDLELEKLTSYNNHELYMNYYNRLSYLGLVEEYNVESDINNYIL